MTDLSDIRLEESVSPRTRGRTLLRLLLIPLAPFLAAGVSVLPMLFPFQFSIGSDDAFRLINATLGALVAAGIAAYLPVRPRFRVAAGIACFFLAYPVFVFAFGIWAAFTVETIEVMNGNRGS